MGSCGNACCSVEVTVADTMPETLYEKILRFLQAGGDGNSYAYVNGTMPFGEHPADDLRSLHFDYKFIVQGTHTTSGRGYVDTLNFNIRSEDNASSVLRAFSISNIAGALGDSGQNYKSLNYLIQEAVGVSDADIEVLYG